MITIADIKNMAQGSLPDSAFDNYPEQFTLLIGNAVAMVEKHLNKPLGVRNYRQYVCDSDYDYTSWGYRLTVARTPIVSVQSQHKLFGTDFILFDSPKQEVEYEAGFEGLPSDIRQVLFNMVMYEHNRSSQNTYNLSTKTVVTGSTTANISKSVQDFYSDELKKLDKYADLSYYSTVVQYEPET